MLRWNDIKLQFSATNTSESFVKKTMNMWKTTSYSQIVIAENLELVLSLGYLTYKRYIWKISKSLKKAVENVQSYSLAYYGELKYSIDNYSSTDFFLFNWMYSNEIFQNLFLKISAYFPSVLLLCVQAVRLLSPALPTLEVVT